MTSSSFKFSKDLCLSIEKLGLTRKTSEKLVEELNILHNTILEEQKITVTTDNADDKNQEYRLEAGDYNKLKELYKKSIKQFEEEEKFVDNFFVIKTILFSILVFYFYC